MSEPLVGATVDTRYELRRLIARGGMGLVFEAHHRFTRRAVALKLLPEELRGKKEIRGRLLREALALTAARHPGFVEVLDAGVCADHGPYVVMEMLDGRTLDGILAARVRLSVEDSVRVGRQVCDAIAHANARGVVHRDLKPSNVFVARNEIGEETVKLIDLGVAAVAEEQLEQHDRKLTQAHEVIGTPEYMAPEQLWGREIDARTDVYAIGMSLFECLTGEVPYVGSYPEVLVQVSNAAEPPSVRDKRPDVPPALAVVIETALEKDAGARFQTAAELGRALVAASGLAPGRSSLLAAIPDESPTSGQGSEEPEAAAIKLVRRKASREREREEDRPSAPSPPPSRRRHFVRAPYVTPVLLLSPTGSEIEARSEEISEEGMLVVTPLPFPLGAPIKMRFASPMTGEMIVLEGSVRWTREGRGRSAMGLEFENVSPVLRGVVAQYIAMLPAAQE
ncbi:MAG: serine/threonine-protein kinase [Polyangiaceae bacterium]